MIPIRLPAVAAVVAAAAPGAAIAQDGGDLFRFCRETAAAAPEFAVRGAAEGWIFLRSELEHIGGGRDWQTSSHPALPVIAAFRKSLEEKGVTLILAPVPAKAAIYPEKLLAGVKPDAVPPLKPFLEELRKTGAVVVDLDTAFREARKSNGEEPLYCATDSHWSPAGVRLAASRIVEAARGVDAVSGLIRPASTFRTGPPASFEIRGDLLAAPGLENVPAETLSLVRAGREESGSIVAVPEDPDSAVVLMGDSHTMVFTDGASLGMHCDAAGLQDHLQALFGFPITRIANRNSGGDGARRILAQRVRSNPDWWAPRKVVIWVFSEREFTQGRWR